MHMFFTGTWYAKFAYLVHKHSGCDSNMTILVFDGHTVS